jgi:CheY-like chemotaxis protein
MLPRVFDMFSQATSALERSEGGLGIGLSLVRGLVLLHNGTIEARSAGPGQGSEFVVRLARLLGNSAGDAQTILVEGTSRRHASLRILVADDNRDSADSCRMLLESSGYEVRVAYSGQQAFDIAANFRPDVALLDIGMPQMNGYQVARRLRSAEWGAEPMLIAMTGWGQESDKQHAREAGFDRHLTKPIDMDRLMLIIEQRASPLGHAPSMDSATLRPAK